MSSSHFLIKLYEKKTMTVYYFLKCSDRINESLVLYVYDKHKRGSSNLFRKNVHSNRIILRLRPQLDLCENLVGE